MDEENERLFHQYREEDIDGIEIAAKIKSNLDLGKRPYEVPLETSMVASTWLAWWATATPSFCETIWASDRPSTIKMTRFLSLPLRRPAIMTAFNCKFDQIKELTPGMRFDY